MFTAEEKKARTEARKADRLALKEAARISAERNQKPIESLTITIEWKKSRTWGSNPNAEGVAIFKNGTRATATAKCSGCGYDKESTVIADIFNQFLKYKLWAMSREQIKGGNGSQDSGLAPYGIDCYNDGNRYFSVGIGTSCYTAISEYIGGTFEHVSSGKTFDVYKYTDA